MFKLVRLMPFVFGGCLVLTAVAGWCTSGVVAATTIISNNFDGDDSNDVGGVFGIVSNPLPQNNTTNASTGLISFSRRDATMGFSSSTSFDAQAYDTLTVTWVVSSVTNGFGQANGWFFGLQSAQGIEGDGSTLWNNNPNSIGVNMFGTKPTGAGSGPGTVSQDSPELAHIDVTSGLNAPGDPALADGFTVSLTINSDNTYSVWSEGLTNDFDQNLTGNFPAGFQYADLGNTTFATMTTQHANTTIMTVQVDSVTVTSGIPVPSIPGDINTDDVVDRLDPSLFVSHYGTETGSSFETGDFDGDASTKLPDLALLQSNFGERAPAEAPVAVPEPSSLLLTVMAIFGCAMLGWRRLAYDRQTRLVAAAVRSADRRL